MSYEQSLKVIIVGAGIAGLTAAISLRQNGHTVEICEASSFAREVGAGITIGPNANGLLRKLGIKPEEHGGIEAGRVAEYQGSTGEKKLDGWQEDLTPYKYSRYLISRIDLHSALKKHAISEEGIGKPVKIHLSSRVTAMDPGSTEKKAVVTIEDGTKYEADLVVGADGVYSAVRQTVTGQSDIPQPHGHSVLRMQIPIERAAADPRTAKYAKTALEEVALWKEGKKQIFFYACDGGKKLNVACGHPDTTLTISEGQSKDIYNQHATKEYLLETYKEYTPDFVHLLSMVEPDGIRLHRLLDLPQRQTWINGRVALIGDAAHPFLPWSGQGAAQAIEDAVALATLLPMGTLSTDVLERLPLYMEARYERASAIQNLCRSIGHSCAKNTNETSKYILNHDAHDNAQYILKRHLEKRFTDLLLSLGPDRPMQNWVR